MSLSLSSPPKKRKQHNEDAAVAGPSTKKIKQDRKHKEKHGRRDQLAEEFILVHASLVVSIPPIFASNPAQGVEEMLDSMVMRYIPTVRGVVLTHSNLQFLQSTAEIQGDCPYAICNVAFDTTVWSPRVGQRLTGKVNLCSPDHVSLLVHRTFNVSIPRHHIPEREWVFEYGPAENDPEYGAGAAAAHDVKVLAEDVAEDAIETGEGADIVMEEENEGVEESSGRWVHVTTGLPLGGSNATLEFTVVGLTIANQMLSLVGSIQPDPFSPEHVAPTQHTPTKKPAPAQAAGLEEEADARLENKDEGDSEAEFDIFAELGRITDRTADEEARRRQKAEKKAAKAERKKRKGNGEEQESRKKGVDDGEKKRKKDAEGADEKRKDDAVSKEAKREKRKIAADGEAEERKPRKKKKHEDK